MLCCGSFMVIMTLLITTWFYHKESNQYKKTLYITKDISEMYQNSLGFEQIVNEELRKQNEDLTKQLQVNGIVLQYLDDSVVYLNKLLKNNKNLSIELARQIIILNYQLDMLMYMLDGRTPKHRYSIPVDTKITTYNPVPEQCDSTPTITAYNLKSRPGVTLAASNDIINLYKLKPGDKFLIPGIDSNAKDKMWVFSDKMNPRWKNRIDLMMRDEKRKFSITRTVFLVKDEI